LSCRASPKDSLAGQFLSRSGPGWWSARAGGFLAKPGLDLGNFAY
jgi:hypothetical protein